MEKIDFSKPTVEKEHPTLGMAGTQKLWRFENGFGASVIQFKMMTGRYGSYTDDDTEWELAVIKFEDGDDDETFTLTYDTPITDDVIGHLQGKDIVKILKKIQKL